MPEQPVTLYGAEYSVYTRIARLALEEKGVAYSFEPVDIFAEGGPPGGYLKRHPFNRIPAFEHEGFHLFEAGAITRYIDESFPGAALQPADPRERARMSQIMSILDSYGFRSMVWDVFFERVRVPQKGGTSDEATIAAGLEVSRRCFAALNSIRGDDTWLAGSSVSLADLYAYPMLTLFRLAREGEKLFQTHPALVDWHVRFSERDSAKVTRHPLELEESD